MKKLFEIKIQNKNWNWNWNWFSQTGGSNLMTLIRKCCLAWSVDLNASKTEKQDSVDYWFLRFIPETGKGAMSEAGCEFHLHQKPDTCLVCSERLNLEEKIHGGWVTSPNLQRLRETSRSVLSSNMLQGESRLKSTVIIWPERQQWITDWISTKQSVRLSCAVRCFLRFRNQGSHV